MPEFILCSIIVLTFATLYARWKKGYYSLFDKISNAYLVLVVVHALYALIMRLLFGPLSLLDISSPFILAYGPFFLIGFKTLAEQEFKKRDAYLHFSPFLVFLLLYIGVVTNPALMDKYFVSFYILQYAYVAISLLGYVFWVLMYRQDLSVSTYSKESRQLIKTSGYSLLLMAIIFAAVLFVNSNDTEFLKVILPALVIYSGVLMSVVLAFIFTINNVVQVQTSPPPVIVKNNVTLNAKPVKVVIPVEEEKPEVKNEEVILPQNQKYNKSALSTVVLDDYKNKLNHLIGIEQVYIDNELTLESLAKKMRMPMHHLTQLFNMHLGENFNQYINRYRVEYACVLLQDRGITMSIEQIAFKSGFNSKVSFNRHFKNITGSTPKEYMHTYKKN